MLVFLLFRFVFKNILDLPKYFSDQNIFAFSDTLCIVIGAAVLLAVCIWLSSVFGHLIRRSGTDLEKPVLIFVAFFVSCPVTLPFLFDIKSLSGSQMLYPFALFVFSIILISKPIVEWLLPIICAIYFIPAELTNEIFFTILRKGSILYVPLLLLFLFLDMMKKQIEPGSKQKKSIQIKSTSAILFFVSLLVSVSSYIYTLVSGKSYSEGFYFTDQQINGYLLFCLLIAVPLLMMFGWVLKSAVKGIFPTTVSDVFIRSHVLLFIIFRNNYYGLWIPFLTISLSLVVFYGIWQRNPMILSSVKTAGDYCSKHKVGVYIILAAMASLSNVSSYMPSILQKLFEKLPF